MLRVVVIYKDGRDTFFDADEVKIFPNVPQSVAYFEGEEPPKIEDLPRAAVCSFRKDGTVVETVHLLDVKEVNILPIP